MKSLAAQVDRLREENVAGDLCEFGVALGGSAVYLASEAGSARRFLGFDVFGMIPPPTDQDGSDTHERYKVIISGKSEGIAGDPYYGYMTDLYERVVATFARYGLPVDDRRIILRKGLFQETVNFRAEDKIALAHIDCDWYDPVLFCLETTVPILSVGGVIILDDYNDYQGCKKAADEFLSQHREIEVLSLQPHAVLRKTR